MHQGLAHFQLARRAWRDFSDREASLYCPRARTGQGLLRGLEQHRRGSRLMSELFIELFSEEIPARMQVKAAEDLRAAITNGLVEAGLSYDGARQHSTPRRLVLSVEG